MIKVYAKTAELKMSRAIAGFSQAELSRRVGISPGFMSQIEQGAGCSPGTAKRIADVLSKNTDEIFVFEDTRIVS